MINRHIPHPLDTPIYTYRCRHKPCRYKRLTPFTPNNPSPITVFYYILNYYLDLHSRICYTLIGMRNLTQIRQWLWLFVLLYIALC